MYKVKIILSLKEGILVHGETILESIIAERNRQRPILLYVFGKWSKAN